VRSRPSPRSTAWIGYLRERRSDAARIERLELQLANDRLDRIERAIESLTDTNKRAASTNDEFRALVRGAFTVQQEQIDGLRKTVEQLAHGWQAYLRTIHPPQ
jgi:transcription elongation GreA/GreB family factor